MARRQMALLLLALTAGIAHAQSDNQFSFTNSYSVITSQISVTIPTAAPSTTTFSGNSSAITGTHNGTASAFSNATSAQITVSSSSYSLTVLAGSVTSSISNSTRNATATSTTSSVRPTNTVPCNGFPEFCNRKYSNISNVCAHNSAFVVKNNAGSNQQLPIIDQLRDGVRMLQGETHWVNNTVYNCHTSCSLLNAGTWQSELEVVANWLRDNPYEVLTILIVNSDFTDVENYVPPITNAGLLPYVYKPAFVPQHLNQWPTLGEMILRNERLVFFMDYQADQSKVPYILDEFTHMFETPFSPQDRNFPCTAQRPPGLNTTEAKEQYMYLANHNLNQAIDVSAILGANIGTILVPNTAELNNTNAQGLQLGQSGAMIGNCTADWDRPPNFFLVDYYNIGSPEPGSVFHAVAAANGVVYNQQCCGSTGGASTLFQDIGLSGSMASVFLGTFLAMSMAFVSL